jgi:hypothetical protein
MLKEISKAHEKKITAIENVDAHVWTGSDDGVICVWNREDFQV